MSGGRFRIFTIALIAGWYRIRPSAHAAALMSSLSRNGRTSLPTSSLPRAVPAQRTDDRRGSAALRLEHRDERLDALRAPSAPRASTASVWISSSSERRLSTSIGTTRASPASISVSTRSLRSCARSSPVRWSSVQSGSALRGSLSSASIRHDAVADLPIGDPGEHLSDARRTDRAADLGEQGAPRAGPACSGWPRPAAAPTRGSPLRPRERPRP